MAENVVIRSSEGEDVVYRNVSGVELASESGGTATFIHNAEIKQADWTQTDSTQKDYIKNKPDLAPAATKGTYASLKEKPFGDIPVVLEETELPFKEDKQYNIYIAEFIAEDEPIPGEIYKVFWDGTEYLCVCHDEKIIEGIEIPYWFGNQTLFWNMGLGENSGEPFCIWRGNTVDGGFAIETLETDAAHTVSIVPVNTVKKLDKKYLPDGIGGGISAAEVTLMLASAGVIEPAADENNSVLTDEKNDIYVY
ncbi:MAG: hypothetical protein IJA05_05985 [Oscillospiraceae bacterium]|nr:hypothetical protein [Oscillospiraceae bacterium]